MSIQKLMTRAGLAAAFVAMASLLVQAETWRFASKMPAESPEGRVFQAFVDDVTKRTGGKLNIRIFPSEQLGKSAATLEQLQKGTIHIYADGSVWMRKWSKQIELINSRFLLKDREAWVRFMNSPMVQGWYREAEAKSGVRVLGDVTGILRGPYRVVVSKRPINSIADFKGLKLRQSKAKMGALAYGALDSEIRALAWTDTYQSIKTGIVEGVTSPAALVEAMRFYEVAPNISRLDAFYQSIAFMVNKAAWDGLSPDMQKALTEAHAAASKLSHEIMQKSTDEAFARMKASGVTFNVLDVGPFVERLRPIYEKMQADGEFPPGFLDVIARANAGTS